MVIFSEKTNKKYASVDECLADEQVFDKEQAERKAAAEKALAEAKAKKEELAKTRKERAQEVEEAYKSILDAQKNYRKVLDAFVRDYGSFHMTLRTGEGNPFDFFENFFDRFW